MRGIASEASFAAFKINETLYFQKNQKKKIVMPYTNLFFCEERALCWYFEYVVYVA